MKNEGLPKIPARIRVSNGTRWLDVRCPFCEEIHSHAGGPVDGPVSYGHRISHCKVLSRDYELIAEG